MNQEEGLEVIKAYNFLCESERRIKDGDFDESKRLISQVREILLCLGGGYDRIIDLFCDEPYTETGSI